MKDKSVEFEREVPDVLQEVILQAIDELFSTYDGHEPFAMALSTVSPRGRHGLFVSTMRFPNDYGQFMTEFLHVVKEINSLVLDDKVSAVLVMEALKATLPVVKEEREQLRREGVDEDEWLQR